MRSLISGVLEVVNKARVPMTTRYDSAGMSGMFSAEGSDEEYMQSMREIGTVYAIVSRQAESLASVDWGLYRPAASGLEADRKPVPTHAVLDLWNEPNPFYTKDLFIETVSQHIILTGKSGWVLSRATPNAPPTEMWPVRPDRLKPVKDPDKFQTGWVYCLGPEKVPLALSEVIFIRKPDPSDPYAGLGAIQPLRTDLQAAALAGEYNRNFFLNSAEPGGIVQVEQRLSDDEFDEMTRRWHDQHKGVSRAHRVAILEQNAKWVDRKYTLKDMEFSALRADSREVVREGMGMPKSMLGSVDDVNRANAEAGEVVFARWLMVPPLNRIKAAANTKLIPMFPTAKSGRLALDYVNPVPEDKAAEDASITARVNAAVALVTVGFDPAETLKSLDLPPLAFTPRPAVPLPAPGALEAAALNGHKHPARV